MYSPFSSRLDVALPTRLIRQGFECVRLGTQYRMHPVLSQFPREHIYNGRFIDGPGVDRPLEDVEPGLRKVLTDIIADSIEDTEKREAYRQEADDAKARLHWIQVQGKKIEDSKSKAVLEHVDLFFDNVFQPLYKYFKDRGKKMKDHVLILCAYRHAVRMIDYASYLRPS